MSPRELSQPVRSLLFSSIESFEDLDVLLFLQRSRGEEFSADALAASLGVSLDVVRDASERFVAEALVDRLGAKGHVSYRFAASGPRARVVDELAQYWKTHQYEVVRLLAENAMQRVRNSAERAFADAFRIGRGKRNG